MPRAAVDIILKLSLDNLLSMYESMGQAATLIWLAHFLDDFEIESQKGRKYGALGCFN